MKLAILALAAFAGAAAAAPSAPLAPAACGVRNTLWIEHYSAQLYVPAGKSAAAVGDPSQPKMLRMQIINPMLMPPDIPGKWRDALEPVLDGATMERLRATYRELQEGDTLEVDYEPQAGIALRVNDRTVAKVAGHAAIDALIAAWTSGVPFEKKIAGTVARNRCA
jgi:hypothetical protein